KGTLIEFSRRKDCETLAAGGFGLSMAKCHGFEHQSHREGWLPIDPHHVEVLEQVPSRIGEGEGVVVPEAPIPIKCGDPVGFLGRYDVAKFGGMVETRHHVHFELFSRQDHEPPQKFLSTFFGEQQVEQIASFQNTSGSEEYFDISEPSEFFVDLYNNVNQTTLTDISGKTILDRLAPWDSCKNVVVETHSEWFKNAEERNFLNTLREQARFECQKRQLDHEKERINNLVWLEQAKEKGLDLGESVWSWWPIGQKQSEYHHKVFAKSAEQPFGYCSVGLEPEPIQNFGPFAFIFGQAHAAAPVVMGANYTVAAQTAQTAQIAAAGAVNSNQYFRGPQEQLALHVDRGFRFIGDSVAAAYEQSFHYKMTTMGISALFALQQNIFGDDTQYTEDELRQMDSVDTRIRVQITDPAPGEYYPHVKAYHVSDVRIPIKYVTKDSNNQLSVTLEEGGPTIYWTPEDGGDPSWQSTPSQDDNFTYDDIIVTPIHSDDEAHVTVTPMPKEQDWKDCVLVFPQDTGIPPLYIVYSESAYSAGFKTHLSSDSYPGVSRGRHYKEANENLLKAMENDSEFASQMKSLGIKIERTSTGLAPRRPPKGWTWHHERENGAMVLVPRSQHTIGSEEWKVLHPENKGGYAIWGKRNEIT
ncbi:S-type pyocin domain-containing protein, partial [Vibrio sp. WXL103]|uniref:S-type pyocin domain-containing protein n=1 Tax=Vibrio sp. WXL103 TaxID=3450710 RepID=UPI003EC7F743